MKYKSGFQGKKFGIRVTTKRNGKRVYKSKSVLSKQIAMRKKVIDKLKKIAKKLGIRVTTKRNGKRVYKSKRVLAKQIQKKETSKKRLSKPKKTYSKKNSFGMDKLAAEKLPSDILKRIFYSGSKTREQWLASFHKIKEWKDFDFKRGEPSELNNQECFSHINEHLTKWTKIDIYDYYGGFQVTLNAGEYENKLLLETNDDPHSDPREGISSRHIQNMLMKCVYKMKNLEYFSFTTRFPGEYPHHVFNKPMRSVKTVRIHHLQLISKFFVKNATRLIIHEFWRNDDFTGGEKYLNRIKKSNPNLIVEIEQYMEEDSEDSEDSED